jgi:Leucine-rich repeat (LRR) protein
MMALYQNLSAKLGFRPGKTANLEDYKLELYNQFRHRRVFLVLDDVWQDKTFDSLNLAKGKGSVTLLSSRNQSLLERASPQIFMEQLTPLSKEDSWSLFRVHAFGAPSNIPDELNALAQTMAEECKGLPLALKVIGRAMIGKFSPELQWEPVLKQLRQSRMPERPVEEQLYMCLKLGYDALSEDDGRLKECFLSFAAFHENHNFSFPNILWLWIGEGWVPGNSEDDPSPDAFSLLKKLTERSLIESIELSDDLLFTDEEKFYTFKIHDVMRDMAFYILKKDSGAKLYNLYRTGQKLKQIPKEFLTMEVLSKVRRLSLYKNQLKELPENMYAPELISLLLGENIMQFAPQLSNFPKLRILDLYGADLDNLPEQLGDLENLVYLDLSECENLRNLPDTVWKLRNLKCLLLWGCSKLDYLPSGMTGLTSLQLLDTTNCDNLRWADHTLSGMPTIKASFEDICKLVALTNLMIWEVVKVPHNISALSNLKILSLQLRKMRTLPTNMAHWCIHLQQLEIEAGESLKHFPKSFTLSGSFPALIKFKIFCSGLIKFPEVEAGALSKLRTLQFAYCNSLKTLPLSLKLLTSLKNLILDTCPTKLEDFCLQNYEQTLC